MLRIGEAAIAYTPPAATLPLVIDLPLPEPYEEPYLEVRLAPDGEVVTMIEPLSHTNKRAGDERRSYLEKRAALIDSTVHFVEIDLLRAHEPMPFAGRPVTDYRIFIHRRELGRRAHLYPFVLRQPIPSFPLPLLPDDPEPWVDLGAILHALYATVLAISSRSTIASYQRRHLTQKMQPGPQIVWQRLWLIKPRRKPALPRT